MTTTTPDRDLLPDWAIRVLLNPGAWRLISTLTEPDVSARPVRPGEPPVAGRTEAHRYSEFLIMLRGRAVFELTGRAYPVAAGDVLLARASERHAMRYAPRGAEPVHLCVNAPHGCLTAQVVHHIGALAVRTPSPPITLSSADLGLNLRQQFTALYDPALPPALRRARFLALAGLLTTAIAARAREPIENDERLAIRRKVIAAVQEHLEETGGAGVTLESLAHLAGYSKFHLLRLFKQQTGQTVHQYLDYCRTIHARHLAAQGHNRKRIAKELGFSCLQTFSRWARRGRLRLVR